MFASGLRRLLSLRLVHLDFPAVSAHEYSNGWRWTKPGKLAGELHEGSAPAAKQPLTLDRVA
jgi:hypothetical protein